MKFITPNNLRTTALSKCFLICSLCHSDWTFCRWY